MKYSLRVTIPLFLLLFAAALGLFSYLYNTRHVNQSVERDATDSLTRQMTRLQGALQYYFARGDQERVQAEVSALGSEPNLIVALVMDEQGLIIASTRRALLGERVDAVLPSLNAGEVSARHARDRAVRTMTGSLYLTSGGMRIVGWYPVLLGTTGSNLRPSRVGLVLMAQDLVALKAQARRGVQSQALQFSLVIVCLSLLLWVFFDVVVARRVRRLIAAAGHLAAGDMNSRTHLTGRDEIGEIGRAFDNMAADIMRGRERLQASERRFRRVVESNMIGIVFWNELGAVTEANDAFLQIIGYRSDDTHGDQLAWRDITPPDDAPLNQILLTKMTQTGTCPPFEQVLIRKDGSRTPVVLGASLLEGSLDQGVCFVLDMTELKRAEAALAEQAIRDPLTGLYNRRYFDMRIQEEMARAGRDQQPLALLICDLDSFKAINDSQGHQFGDEVLKEVASCIGRSVRGSDLIFRWGGDEFVVVLSNTKRDGILPATERIRTGVAQVASQWSPGLDVSIGVAFYPEHASETNSLIRLADRALYIAKKGGDKVHVGEEEYRLDDQAIRIVFQPVMDVRLNQVLGYEALSRDPQGQRSILGLFKKFQAVGQLRQLKSLCFHLQLKLATELTLHRVFINVDFHLLSHEAPPPIPNEMEIILEISEAEALRDVESYLDVAKKWRNEGYKFAVDDFGAGFISLPFIARLIPDYIKLDRSTVLHAVSSEHFRRVLDRMLHALHSCSSDGIIAEGIETEKELHVMKGMGLYLFQGYLWGHPQELSRLPQGRIGRSSS